ncbi:unnamed protein product [Dovyalis caffra]|uniref:Ubiquitin-like domain-containing protein n=1 Tax=Dovyalis caffra TaxID=77055 RepID=A0AAV1SKX3_9ROSI|nr:unnamed protein product [Dovyalis caffra]
MKLKVVYGDKIFCADLEVDSTVLELKQLLAENVALPVENQQLDFDDIILSNHTPLKHYKIDPDSWILLRDLYEIFFETNTQDGRGIRRFRLLVHQNNKLKELKNMLHLRHGFVIEDNMTLRVECPFGHIYADNDNREIFEYQIFTGITMHLIKIVYVNAKEYDMLVGDDETVLEIKNRIYSLFGKEIPVEKQQLEFNDLVMQDENTMQCYEIDNYDKIIVRKMYGISVFRPLNLLSGLSNQRYGLIVHKDYTVRDLKLMLHRQYGFDFTRIQLILPNLSDNYLMDSVKIEDYGIVAGSTVTMQVRIAFNDTEYNVVLADNATVLALKYRLHDMFSLPTSAQELEFNGFILEDLETTLESYHIANNAKIILREIFVISVHVVQLVEDGKPDPNEQFPIPVHKEYTIGHLKEILSVRYGLDFSNMKIGLSKMWNTDLDDCTQIGAYNLRDRSRLYAFKMY